MFKMSQEEDSQKRKGRMQMWAVRTLVCSDRRLGVRLTAEEMNMGLCSEERNAKSGLKSEFPTMKML
jgi:hypothetical protein